MVIVQKRSLRKPSGGRYKVMPPKRLSQKGSLPTHTLINERKVKSVRTKGGGVKNKLMSVDKINVYDPAQKKHVVAEIKNVVENPANRHFERRNIITKGAVLETSIGKVRVTNRPGQEGTLNGVKVE